MTVRAFFAHHCRASNALSFFLSLLLLLPSFSVIAQPSVQTARQVKPHASPKTQDKPVDQLKVGDVIPARSNATGKVEWKQVTHASKRTVPSLLSVQLTDARTGKPAETLTCPLDQPVTLSSGKSVPAGRLSVGNCMVTRAGPVCKVTALFLLRKPGGFVLCDVRVGPLSAAKAKLLALSQARQAQSSVRFADYKIPASRVSYAAPASTSSGLFNPFLFQGQQYDPASNTYYLRDRYYDPTSGRFLSHDPLAGNDFSPISLPRYLYANDDPVNFVDPTGDEGELLETVTVNTGQTQIGSTEAGATLKTYQASSSILRQLDELEQLKNGIAVGEGTYTFGLNALRTGAAAPLLARGIAATVLASTIGSIFQGGGSSVGDAVEGDEPSLYLFHYTTKEGLRDILASGVLDPNREGAVAEFGSGAYLTDLPPIGLLPQKDYTVALFRTKRADVQPKVEAWILLRLPVRLVQRVRGIYADKIGGENGARRASVQGYSIYLLPGNQAIPLAGNVAGYGATTFLSE